MEINTIKNKEIIKIFLSKKIFLTKEFLTQIKEDEFKKVDEILTNKTKNLPLFFSKGILDLLTRTGYEDINWEELERAKALSEKKKDPSIYLKFLSCLNEGKNQKKEDFGINIIFSYDADPKKREVQHFVSYFNKRYKSIERMLRTRNELQNLTSINRILSKREREQISFICIVKTKNYTKNNNIILEVEDPTGQIKAIINKNKADLYEHAKDIVPDEVIGVSGVNGEKIVFVNEVVWPEIPIKELKKTEEESYAVFLSDLHVGSNNFLPEKFNKFLKWINQEYGSEKHHEIAKKTKYIFIVGDLVDGCGIYPGQEEELVIKDIYEQYKECAVFLDKIPKNINLIICPGNHDAMRISEPQPALYKDFSEPIWNLGNATIISNPSLVNIGASKNFPGFDVLLYHGYSFDYFVAHVEGIRNNGGYDRADLLMKFLLKRRHLAPSHKSTLYIPDTELDPLVIGRVPDIFATGHIHKAAALNYKNITLICGSCWQSKTSFQEKVGHNPEPCRVPVVNLKTREIKMLKF